MNNLDKILEAKPRKTGKQKCQNIQPAKMKKILMMAIASFNLIAAVPKPKLSTSPASLRRRDGSELIPMEYWHLLIRKQAMGLPVSARSIYFQAIKAAALLKKILKQSGVTKLSKPQAVVQNP